MIADEFHFKVGLLHCHTVWLHKPPNSLPSFAPCHEAYIKSIDVLRIGTCSLELFLVNKLINDSAVLTRTVHGIHSAFFSRSWHLSASRVSTCPSPPLKTIPAFSSAPFALFSLMSPHIVITSAMIHLTWFGSQHFLLASSTRLPKQSVCRRRSVPALRSI